MRGSRTIPPGRLLALGILGACGGPAPLQPAVAGPSPGAPSVLILKGSDSALLNSPVAAFQQEVADFARVYVLTVSDDPAATRESIAGVEPQLIVALGAKAALWARQSRPHIPMLFAMVMDYQRLPELRWPGVMGVSLEVPAVAEFTQFKMVMPAMKNVLTFYSPHSSPARVAEAVRMLETLGIQLNAVQVGDAKHLQELYRAQRANNDALWLMNDPMVMNEGTFAYLRDQAVADRLAFVSSLSDKFARNGALMSVSVDFSSIGFQAAAMARRFLQGKEPATDIGIQPPISANLVLNLAVAQAIGLTVPEEVLPFINEIVSAGSSSLSQAKP